MYVLLIILNLIIVEYFANDFISKFLYGYLISVLLFYNNTHKYHI